jgi:hypothetical protein
MVIAEQLINFPSCATTSVHVTKRKFSLEVLLIAETLQNVSEFREVQLNCSGINFGITCIQFWLTFCEWIAKVITSAVSVEPLTELNHSYGRLYAKTAYPDSDEQTTSLLQSTMVHYSELLRHMVTIWSFPLPSFGNRTKLQWEPGIALVYQQGVQNNYNAKHLLSSEQYLQMCKMDIIFIMCLPP